MHAASSSDSSVFTSSSSFALPRAAVRLLASSPPPPLATPLLIADAGVMLAYSMSLSTCRAFAMAMGEGFDVASDLSDFDMHLTVQFISIEEYSAVALAVAWLVGGSLAGAFDVDWLARGASEHARAPLGLVGVLRGWAYAAPIVFVAKAVGVAAVILPVGGWLALDAPTAVQDLGGMLLAIVVWRRWLLRALGESSS